MKKLIAVVLIITLFISALLLSIPKKNLPTDKEWEEFLEWEEEQIALGRY